MLAVGVAWGFRATGELVLHGASKILTHPMDLIAMLE
jgi:phosphoglycolate phosphatase-like HAD superfamily hydrolase